MLSALDSDLRVGLNPDMHPDLRHGSVWFEVSGFGRLKRDFMVNLPELLAAQSDQLALPVARQIMLLDRSLPKKEHVCKPVKIDIRVAGMRRVYDLVTLEVMLDQQT